MEEEINNKFKEIFYSDEEGNYYPLFKENSLEKIVNLYKEIKETNNSNLILEEITFIYNIILKNIDIAIILESSPSIKIEKEISFIELLCEIYVKFPSEKKLQEKILEILKFLINNISIKPNSYFYLLRSTVNTVKNPTIESFNNYIDLLEVFYPKIEKEEKREKQDKYFYFYNKLESGIQVNNNIIIEKGFAFKFWFYLEKYHKNKNSSLIKITIGEDIYKLNLNEKEINIIINDEIQEELNYKINEEEWNNIVFGITKTTSNNIILFSYKKEDEKKKTKIKGIPIEIENIYLNSIIFFENFIGKVSSIILYNDLNYGVFDYFKDDEFKQPNKLLFNSDYNKTIYSCFSPQTLDLDRMEIEDPINHYNAYYIKSNNFHLNYAHIIHKKKNNLYNYFGLGNFFPLFDFIYDKYNNENGVSLFNRLFNIIILRINELQESSKNQFFKNFSCFLKNLNKCFLENNECLNNFLYDNVFLFSKSNINDKKPPFLNDILFNYKIMIKFSEKEQRKFWDFIYEKINELYTDNSNSSNILYKFLDLEYLNSFFFHEFKKDFNISENQNFIKILKLIMTRNKHNKYDNNKDKLFFFRFLLNPKISFQKVEFILLLFLSFINGEEKFQDDQITNIIKYFLTKEFIIDLFLFFVRYPINIKEIIIQIFRYLMLNYYDIVNKTSNIHKNNIKDIIDNFFLNEYNFFEKKEIKNEEIKNEEEEDVINTNINKNLINEQIENNNNNNNEKKILKIDSKDNLSFLIINIFHLTFRCIIYEWTNDNLEFEYKEIENFNIENVKLTIEKSFNNICDLILKENNEIYYKLFLNNNFLKIFGKIYFDNFLLIKKEDINLTNLTELIDKKGENVITKLNNDIIINIKIIPFQYIAFLIYLNYKLFNEDKETSFAFLDYFFEKIKIYDKIKSYEQETKDNFNKLLKYAEIENYNYSVDDRIFTLSSNQLKKFVEYLKKRDDYYYIHICNNLKKGIDTLKYIFYYSIYLIHEGFIKENYQKINEYFTFIFSLILCEIQHKFDNGDIVVESLEKTYDFFFLNFFNFYYLNPQKQKDYIKIFANILRLAKLIRELYFLNGYFKIFIQKDCKIYNSFEKFKIIELNTTQDNPNKNYNFSLKDLNEILTQSDDDVNSNLIKKLEAQKSCYLNIILNNFYNEPIIEDDNKLVNIKKVIDSNYESRKLDFKKEYLDEKNKNEYINAIMNNKIYRKLKKFLHSFNQPFSDFNIFYTEEGKKKLKYKIFNHVTSQFIHPLLTPIFDVTYYLPKEFNPESFNDNLIDIYHLNLHSFQFKEKLNFINNTYKNCCLVKITHHIIGFFNVERDKFEFFGKKLLKTKRTNDPHFNKKKEKCFGNLLDSYHENEDYYLQIKISNIQYAIKRNYYYSDIGLEIYTTYNKNYFFVFQEENYIDQLIKTINKPELNIDDIYNKWFYQNKISTFEFIMYLNVFGNRSYNDITQYPIFPWIFPNPVLNLEITEIKKESSNNNNNNHNNYPNFKLSLLEINNVRDLSKPMGLIDSDNKSNLRKESYINNYQSMILDLCTINTFKYEDESHYKTNNFFDWHKIPYCFGSHYSNQVYVSHYLIRLFPFTLTSLEIQKWEFDLPERLFFNLENSYYNSIREKSDVRELIPEFFYLPDLFNNINNFNFGYILSDIDRSKININNVILPDWAKNRSDIVVYVLRELLEGINKEKIFDWVNLIFGENQFGNNAANIYNIFLPYSYEYWAHKKINNLCPDDDINDIKTYFELGVCPSQLFKKKKNFKKKNTNLENKENELDIENCGIIYEKLICNENIKDVYFIMFNSLNQNIQFVKKENIIEKDKNNNIIYQINYSNNKLSSFKKLLCGQIKDIFIITGFYNGFVFIFGKNENEEIRSKNPIINSRDMSMITALEINKKETEIYLGTKKGSIIIYRYKKEKKDKNESLIFHRMIHNNIKRINYINSNDKLNLFISCSEDGFINLYLYLTCELIGSIYNKVKCDYVFLFNSPLPSFTTFSNSNSKFNCYTINGNEIDLKDFDIQNKIIEIPNERIYSPLIITNKFKDYLIYISNRKEIVIRRAPYMEYIRSIFIKFDNLLLTSIKYINNNIYVAVTSKGTIYINKLVPKNMIK